MEELLEVDWTAVDDRRRRQVFHRSPETSEDWGG